MTESYELILGTGEREMAEEIERRVSLRLARKRKQGSAYHPDTSRQDNDLIGLDLDDLLMRLRVLVGAGELIDPDLVRKMDSALSRGRVPPQAWRYANYRELASYVDGIMRDLGNTQATARRLSEELSERERQERQS
jgi:hypothetical protein